MNVASCSDDPVLLDLNRYAFFAEPLMPVYQNSNQPTSEGAFLIKVRRVLRGLDSTIFYYLFHAFSALKNSA
jgi:hypothetical protein